MLPGLVQARQVSHTGGHPQCCEAEVGGVLQGIVAGSVGEALLAVGAAAAGGPPSPKPSIASAQGGAKCGSAHQCPRPY